MKLPIIYLLEKLDDLLETTIMDDAEVGYLVERPRFYENENLLKREMLYLAEGVILSGCRQETGAFVIGRGTGFHTFCIKAGKSICEVSNRIHQLFHEVEEWQEQMKQCSDKNGSMKDVLNIAGRYLPYYIGVMDPEFMILERYLPDEDSNKDIHEENGYLKMDIVNVLKQDVYYDAMESYKNAFIYEARGLKDRFLCVNLLEGDKFRGRINVREAEDERFHEWEGFFLEQVRDVIVSVFLKESHLQDHTLRQRNFVQMLLEGKENYRDELYLFLNDVHWNEHDAYRCICLQMQSIDEEESVQYMQRNWNIR